MGIGFVLVGITLIVTGAQNTYAAMGTQLTKDFTGPGNFTYWLISLAAVGALGYIPAFQKFSTYFMALILLALFLGKGKGFFAQFQSALASGPVAPNSSGVAGTSAPAGSNVVAALQGLISPSQALTNQTSSAGGTPTTNPGQAKFNGWMNYFFGTNQAPVTQ